MTPIRFNITGILHCLDCGVNWKSDDGLVDQRGSILRNGQTFVFFQVGIDTPAHYCYTPTSDFDYNTERVLT